MKFALTLPAALVLAACATVDPAPPAPAGPATQANWDAGNSAYLAWNGARRGWTTTESGLQYRRVEAHPDGAQPSANDTVKVHYRGTFIDGREFDSSRTRGEPATFPLGRLIKGWQEGVPMMRVGERWLFAIPADLGYGDCNRDPIPNGSALLFDIELIAIPEPSAG